MREKPHGYWRFKHFGERLRAPRMCCLVDVQPGYFFFFLAFLVAFFAAFLTAFFAFFLAAIVSILPLIYISPQHDVLQLSNV
jgi:hypothetical protein